MSSSNIIIQFILWLVAFLELIIGLYALILNYRHIANKYASILMLFISINTFSIGMLLGSQSIGGARIPTLILAATTASIPPLILITSIAIINPNWFSKSRNKFWVGVLHVIVVIPILLTIIDALTGKNLWFTGLSASIYHGGFVSISAYTQGKIAPIIKVINYQITTIILLVMLIHFSFRDKNANSQQKILSRLLLVAVIITFITTILPPYIIPPIIRAFAASLVFATIFSYAGFTQLISSRTMQKGSMQSRLIWMIMVVVVPLMIGLTLMITNLAENEIKGESLTYLKNTNHDLSSTTSLWLNYNLLALQNLMDRPEILSQNPIQQQPLLWKMTHDYPHMYLVATLNMAGVNIGRSDEKKPKIYADRQWFQAIVQGEPFFFQTLIGRTSGKPALVVSVPIRDEFNQLAGVGMFASSLEDISAEVKASSSTRGTIAYIIDENDFLVAHPYTQQISRLINMGDNQAVQALRSGEQGTITFRDENNNLYYANVSELPNGWGIIVQQSEKSLLAPIKRFRQLAWFFSVIAIIFLVAITSLSVRQSLKPIKELTKTADSIAKGDFYQEAVVESEDEIGILARSFNTMTAQLRDLITSLETRVAERTRDINIRANQLKVTAEVAREAAAIQDYQQLLANVVDMISNRFGFYHVGIFILQALPDANYAVLRAANSEGGKKMLARNHRLKVGKEGIVGYVASTGEARIALDVGTDAVFFNNPDLPQTRSEMALPLKVHEQIIGILDVQSIKSNAFNEDDIATLQILADQIALALRNSELLSDLQKSYQELREEYKSYLIESWSEQLDKKSYAFIYQGNNVKPIEMHDSSSTLQKIRTAEKSHYLSQKSTDDTKFELIVPIELYGKQLGILQLSREKEAGPWKENEINMLKKSANQVALALENARLLIEIKKRATRDRILGDVTSKIRETLDIQTVLETATKEIFNVLDMETVKITLADEDIRTPIIQPNTIQTTEFNDNGAKE